MQAAEIEALPTHVLVNSKGLEVHISPVGAAIERINVPDRSGRLTDVVLGFDKKTPYAARLCVTAPRMHVLGDLLDLVD